MKVALLGAAGTIARAIVRDLAESEEVSELRLIDLDGDGAARGALEQGGERTTCADAGEPLADCDLLLNSAAYRINLDAMEAALGGGIVSTAAPAAAAVRMFARGQIERRGVMAPEPCVDPNLLFPEFERRNCSFAVVAA